MTESVDFTVRAHLDASPEAVYRALTDATELEVWFTEHADVSLPDGRYEFWGRYTPDGERGRQRLLDAEAGRRLRFAWVLDDAERTVDVTLAPEDAGTVLTVAERDADGKPVLAGNFWFLAIANLANHVEGRTVAPRYEYAHAVTDTAIVETVIDAPPERVFAALLEPDQLSRWMMAKDAEVDPHVGGRYEIGWDHDGPMKILELEPDRILAYSWRYPGSRDTVVRWELDGSEGRTHLTVVHSGFDDPDLAEQFRNGWPGFLVDLKRLLELGPERRGIDANY